VLLDWNPDTFANKVLWKGAVLTNLPVLAGPAALTFQKGQTVALLGWAPGGGTGSWTILGQWVSPGSTAAASQIEFMQTALAKATVDELVAQLLTSPAGIELAQFVASKTTHFDSDTGAGSVASSSWSNLTGASVGPTCADVLISAERRALVIVGALMTAAANERPHMSFAVTGASTFTPGTGFDDQFDLRLRTANQGFDGRMSAVIPLGPDELDTAGLCTFTAKYRATIGTPSFSARTLAVIAY
jgi:hypothetical protein